MNADEYVAKCATAWTGQPVTAVEAVADDWIGSTDDGFRSIFELDLIGPGYRRRLAGEELGQFWQYVMQQPLSDPSATVTT